MVEQHLYPSDSTASPDIDMSGGAGQLTIEVDTWKIPYIPFPFAETEAVSVQQDTPETMTLSDVEAWGPIVAVAALTSVLAFKSKKNR